MVIDDGKAIAATGAAMPKAGRISDIQAGIDAARTRGVTLRRPGITGRRRAIAWARPDHARLASARFRWLPPCPCGHGARP